MTSMEKTQKIGRIGILTSGGDAPGMNAAIRAVTRYAIKQGIEVYGIYEGYHGLITGEGCIEKFSSHRVANIIQKGGTILYSARCPEFKEKAGVLCGADVCRKFGIEGIIAIGGDGTFRGASDLCTIGGIPCIGIPGSIDNDITCTDASIGYDTAMNTVVEAVDRLRDTCESHARCDVVEVMGRHAGYIALDTAIAIGATAVVIKEDPNFDEDKLIQRMLADRAAGKRNFIVIVAEGVEGYSEKLAAAIQEKTKAAGNEIETKFARLAHIVRGGSPTLSDRVLAARMGVEAVNLLLNGSQNKFVCERNGRMEARDIQEALLIDRMYKSSFTPNINFSSKELEGYSPEKVQEMENFCAMRREQVRERLDILQNISNYY